MSTAELNMLKAHMQMRVKPIMSRTEAKNDIDAYFASITWSILKDEWEKMSNTEKMAFAEKLWKETR